MPDIDAQDFRDGGLACFCDGPLHSDLRHMDLKISRVKELPAYWTGAAS
jgi:hypothetical protein